MFRKHARLPNRLRDYQRVPHRALDAGENAVCSVDRLDDNLDAIDPTVAHVARSAFIADATQLFSAKPFSSASAKRLGRHAKPPR